MNNSSRSKHPEQNNSRKIHKIKRNVKHQQNEKKIKTKRKKYSNLGNVGKIYEIIYQNKYAGLEIKINY